MKKVKVTIDARDHGIERGFNLVKIGPYPFTAEGVIAALRDGTLERFKREAPHYEVISFETHETKRSKTVKTNQETIETICTFKFRQYVDETLDEDTACDVTGKVTFSVIVSKK